MRKTVIVSYRVTDLARSLDFYRALGYIEVGTVSLDDGSRLVVLKFPGEPVATLELAHRPADGRVEIGTGFDHLAVQVDALAVTIDQLNAAGLAPSQAHLPGGPQGPRTAWITDADGARVDWVGAREGRYERV